VSGTVGPVDLIEAAWVRDVVDLIWEALRLRRLKAALMTSAAQWGVSDVLDSIGVPWDQRRKIMPRWAARKLDAVEAVDTELEAAGLGMDHVMAQTLRRLIDQVERIDRMIASAEARRAATLREIAGWRHELAAGLRRAAYAAIEDGAIEDAAFAVVEDAETAAVPAAPA
jgi:hypothetical protein